MCFFFFKILRSGPDVQRMGGVFPTTDKEERHPEFSEFCSGTRQGNKLSGDEPQKPSVKTLERLFARRATMVKSSKLWSVVQKNIYQK